MLRNKINKVKLNKIKFTGVFFSFYNGVIVHILLCLTFLLCTIYMCLYMSLKQCSP